MSRAIPVDRRFATILLVCVMLLLLFATILTGSRTGIALIPLALLASCLIVRPSLADIGRWRDLPALIALVAVIAVVSYALFGGNRALDNVVARFDLSGNRTELWQDAWYATQSAWPLGVGMGGAQPALIAAERLEILDRSLPNRVHNDYLELALEGGLPAVLLFAAVAVTLMVLAVRTWQSRPQERILTGLGLTILVIAAAHSFVDYPLRSMALACLIGMGAGLLIASRGAQSAASGLKREQTP